MAFQVSPGVITKEVDKTNVVPPVSSGIGALVGHFTKGPVEEITIINSEEELVSTFGKPNSTNFEDWFTAANFLQYSSNLRVIRADAAAAKNAGATGAADIKNKTDYDESAAAGQLSVGAWIARSHGTHGNALGVSVCHGSAGFTEQLEAAAGGVDGAKAIGDTSITSSDGSKINVGDIISFDGTSGTAGHAQLYEVSAKPSANNLTIKKLDDPNGGGLTEAVVDNEKITRRWRFYDYFNTAPSSSTWATSNSTSLDEMHIVVYDNTGGITGYDVDSNGQRGNAVLETFGYVSQGSGAKTSQGGSNNYVDVINNTSKHIYWSDHDTSGIGADLGATASNAGASYAQKANNAQVTTYELQGGVDATPSVGEKKTSLDLFGSDTVGIDLVMAGKCADGATGITHATNIVSLADGRKDCVAFISPRNADCVGGATSSSKTSSVTGFFDNISSSSYAVFDCGYKYMFDKYNDVYRYVPLNGDIAGITANTDMVADAWFSPAGYNRGQVRSATKLAWNPSKAERDTLYQARVNPVCTFPGQGTVLFGDKTALSRPSAFDRINVRRLFLVLEKAIATAAKYQMFEFNDAFTRAQFVNLVEPFLRDVQGRRGITDFSVVADETNNTMEVIDRNEFVGDIFVKPARSINYITLNFIAVRTGVAFSEIGG